MPINYELLSAELTSDIQNNVHLDLDWFLDIQEQIIADVQEILEGFIPAFINFLQNSSEIDSTFAVMEEHPKLGIDPFSIFFELCLLRGYNAIELMSSFNSPTLKKVLRNIQNEVRSAIDHTQLDELFGLIPPDDHDSIISRLN